MVAGIYCITNKINNKKYFGQSTNIEQRKKDYFNKNHFPNDHLESAFNKYGKENFKFEIIKCCKEKYLDRFEKLYIRINDTMNPDKGYNKESGGNLNKHLSDETRKKIRENMPDYSGENHPMWGEERTSETCKKISKSLIGHEVSNETRKKISKALSGKNNPLWKDYPRIKKNGKNNIGKQQYAIMYNGKIFAISVYKKRLFEKWYSKYPDIELFDETI